jgi:heme/copper-type cytochrome/quinol oxidase subunit 1
MDGKMEAIHFPREATVTLNTGRSAILFACLAGVLITMGFGVIAVWLSFLVWSHHMFIVGLQFPRAAIALSLPVILVAAGIVSLIAALRRIRV